MAEKGTEVNNAGTQSKPVYETKLYRRIHRTLGAYRHTATRNLEWLFTTMHPYFFITMKEEVATIATLAERLRDVINQQKVTLLDERDRLIVARLDLPGSIYDTLKTIRERGISYAEMSHSYETMPGSDHALEIQCFEFDRKQQHEITSAGKPRLSRGVKKGVLETMRDLYPGYDIRDFHCDLNLIGINNEKYLRISPHERIARVLWLYQQARRHEGLFLDVETKEDVRGRRESRILFSVRNPPQRGFLTQISEVFQRLKIGVRRSYSLFISTDIQHYFLGTFYVTDSGGTLIDRRSDLFDTLKKELYNTQILSPSSIAYTDFVSPRLMTGEEASLTNAFVAFCYTTLAHNQPDRFAREVIMNAFHANPDITLQLISTFEKRFAPGAENRREAYEEILEETEQSIENYTTGHKYRDEARKTIFRTCLLFIRYTLKTNFFIPEKSALAFRLDPAYLAELSPELISDLPPGSPFRITFFYGRYGVGYHIGFSDIARGGWRTIICNNHDEYIANATTLFREVYVLAHTQHLKNKDIYEGGSKMTVVLGAEGLESSDAVTQRLYKVQYGFINAFLDIFVTDGGEVKDSRVVDYYGEDEPIELGPDENMHDNMIELIAKQSATRGYLLGIAIMSSKRVGINHKEYGVTSRGVIKFAEIAMKEMGIDMYRDPFTVKITGGTNGDVAGNSMKLLLERYPEVRIRSIAAGSGGMFDPEGADKDELRKIVLRRNVDAFNPEKLHRGGYLLYRKERKKEGLRNLFKKIVRAESGLETQWITADEFQRDFENLIFSVKADLFLPCGGRPEMIDGVNWERLFADDGQPTAWVISEGANSYIIPEAREALQRRGIIVLRDASANKCGVISSSYEIIANLLMTEKEFLQYKETYINDVLGILDRRAEEEAMLIFKRYHEHEGQRLFTEITRNISAEINGYYDRIFSYFQEHPALVRSSRFQKVVQHHLPVFIREHRKFRSRVSRLPPKILFAILASEIATSIVYHGGWDVSFEKQLNEYIAQQFQ